jgi:hypothetical protein
MPAVEVRYGTARPSAASLARHLGTEVRNLNELIRIASSDFVVPANDGIGGLRRASSLGFSFRPSTLLFQASDFLFYCFALRWACSQTFEIGEARSKAMH